MAGRTCEDCIFWERCADHKGNARDGQNAPRKRVQGKCKAGPPTVVIQEGMIKTYFPRTDAVELACGQFEIGPARQTHAGGRP